MKKVLIVDDDPSVRNMLKKIVEKEGFEASVAEDGVQALEQFRDARPGIVLTDLKMPNIDGMEVLHTVKKLDPTTQVILMTGHGNYDLAVDALRGGALDYLRKPIELDDLLLALARAKENLVKLRNEVAKQHVLVIDDDQLARNKVAKILGKEGYVVSTAGDGEEGLTRFGESRADIVLVDLKMPKKDGLEVLREITKMTTDVETIVVTGYGDEESAIRAMREGASNYLRKPVDLDQMLIAVRRAAETLELKRSIKFRTRELELSQEVVARLTRTRELLIDVRGGRRSEVLDFAESVLDAMPLKLFAVDRELNVAYANTAIGKCVSAEFRTASHERFTELGLAKLSVADFRSLVERIFDSSTPLVECVEVGRFAFVVATKLFVLTDDGTKKLVLVVLRGEREP